VIVLQILLTVVWATFILSAMGAAVGHLVEHGKSEFLSLWAALMLIVFGVLLGLALPVYLLSRRWQ